MANILNTYVNSSQGDLTDTLSVVKSGKVNRSKKSVLAVEGYVEIPYFSFKNEVEDTQSDIYKALHLQASKSLQFLDKNDRKQTALVIGTSIIDWNIADSIGATLDNQEYNSKKLSIDSYAEELSQEFGLHGHTLTINTACTSSANALLEANNLVNTGIFKYVLVLGVEVFSKIMSSGFNSMQLLSPDNLQPFDNSRNGMILGEAVASALVGSEKSEWSIRGGFSNCNGVNITAVSPEGNEFVDVMSNAMLNAKVTTNEIRALKSHATGTLSNDLSELNAITKVFDKSLTFTALKPYVGHTVGACGLLEIALFMACIDEGFIPKTLNHKDSMDSEYRPILKDELCKSGVFMMNYFGFGGNNTSIIIEKECV